MAPPPGRKSRLSQEASLSWQQVHVAIVSVTDPPTEEQVPCALPAAVLGCCGGRAALPCLPRSPEPEPFCPGLHTLTPLQVELLAGLLERFVRENEDPRSSPHLRATSADRLDALVALLARGDLARHCRDIRLLVLKVCVATAGQPGEDGRLGGPAGLLLLPLHAPWEASSYPGPTCRHHPPRLPTPPLQAAKILARRQDVRLRCTPHILEALAPLLALAPAGGKPAVLGPVPEAAAAAAEAANALSNLCYEPANATALLKAGGVERLLQLLAAPPAADGPRVSDVQINAAGALQTLSFQPDGRAALLTASAPVTVLAALQRCDGEEGAESGSGSAESRLAQRLVGALHNLSSSAEGVAAIRQAGGIRPIVRMVSRRDGDRGVAAAAAGALQNLSLEAAAAADIQADPQALPALAALLVGPDTQVGGGMRKPPLGGYLT